MLLVPNLVMKYDVFSNYNNVKSYRLVPFR